MYNAKREEGLKDKSREDRGLNRNEGNTHSGVKNTKRENTIVI